MHNTLMIEKGDKIVKMVLISSHDADHLYKKPNGTFYWQHHRKDGDTFSIPEIQLEMFPPPPPKKITFTQEQLDRAPHHNMLEKYYGKDWEVKPVEGLEDHY
tara:strand:- start:56 stop:361 length:306 start_codon:yes stop_codon:yes gene_type:complete